jgi:hemerythrin-like domain-containing protein
VARTLSAMSAMSRTERRLVKQLHQFVCEPSDPPTWPVEHAQATPQLPEHFRPLAGAVDCTLAVIPKAIYKVQWLKGTNDCARPSWPSLGRQLQSIACGLSHQRYDVMQGHPIDELGSEHRVIEQVVDGLGAFAGRIADGGDVHIPALQRLVEFLRVFVDECHHGKEELLLFPALEEQGVSGTGCPLGGHLAEHKKGRVLVDELEQACAAFEAQATSSTRRQLIERLRMLRDLYSAHIWKEDNLLFPLAARVLTETDVDTLQTQFRSVDARIGPERIKAHVDFAVWWADHAGI